MSNVWEWTQSLYADYPYDAGDGRERMTDPGADVNRVLRGGGWLDRPAYSRAANRSWNPPQERDNIIGFRCVIEI